MTHKNMSDYVNINELGCWIDGSHIKSSDLDLNIIQVAINFGFTLDKEAAQLKADIENETSIGEIEQDVYDLAQHAIEWMNDNCPEGFYFYVDDSCLYLSHKDEEGTEYNA